MVEEGSEVSEEPFFFLFCATTLFSALTSAIVFAVISSASRCCLASNGVSSPCFSLNNFVAASSNAGDGFSTSPSAAKNSFVSRDCSSFAFSDDFFQLLLGIAPNPAASAFAKAVSSSLPCPSRRRVSSYPPKLAAAASSVSIFSISLLDGIFVVYFCNNALSSSRTINPLKKWFFPPTGAFAATPSLITPNLAEGKIPRGLRWPPPPLTAVFVAPTLPRLFAVVVVFPVAIATPAPTANAIAMNVFFLDQ